MTRKTLRRLAARILGIAANQLDFVGRERAGIELHVHLHAAVHLLAELGAHARVGQDDADLHRLRERAARGEHG